MKTCKDCGLEKDDAQFYKDGKNLSTYCKPCFIDRNHGANIKLRFGVTKEWYKNKFDEQKGLCALCGKKDSVGRRLAVDHDHDTDEVRDLLCMRCNTALGSFNDSIETLEAAITYLHKWGK